MENQTSNSWVRNNEDGYQPWKAGYTTSQLLDLNASGSSSFGQLADLYNTNTNADWPVSLRGALIHPTNIHRTRISSAWETAEIKLAEETDIQEQQIRTTAEKLEFIKDSFGITLSQLAKILRTSRPSIYSWLEGEEPRENTSLRIQQIYECAEHWAQKNEFHYSPGPIFRQPLGKEPSVLDRLTKEELDMEEIEAGLKSMMELMIRRRERIERSKNKTQNSTIDQKNIAKNRHALTRTTGHND